MRSFITLITEYSKGGGGYVPSPPDPMAEAKARDWEAQQNAIRAKAEQDRRDKLAAEEKALNINQSRERVARGYDSSLSMGNQRLSSKGIATDTGYGSEVMNLFRSALDRARAGAPEIVNDANTLFTPSMFDDAYGTVRSKARSNLNKELQGFMGDGFEYNAFADTADDDIIASILGEQKTEAQSALDRALARGQINDLGYTTGLRELATQEAAGRSKANQLGLGVLSGYRKNLTDFGNQTRTKVDAYDLGDSFDVGGVKNRLDTMTSGYKGSLQGDILAALGGQNFFNTDTLIGKAGNATGIANNSPTGTPAVKGNTTGLLGSPLDERSATNTQGSTQRNQVF